MAYIYQADIYCDDCGEAICERLRQAGEAPADPTDEWSYDSDNYPKRCGDDEESDTPQHCACGADCLNAITVPSGYKVGLLFGELTLDGIAYVKDYITDSPGEVTDLWRQHYTDAGYDLR